MADTDFLRQASGYVIVKLDCLLAVKWGYIMTSPRTGLSVENLESRLNLSTLAGIAVPAAVDVPIYAQERAMLAQQQVISLSDVIADAQPAAGASGEGAAQ